MSSGIGPIGKIVYVCDDVVSDPTSHKFHIIGAFSSLRLPAGEGFPYQHGRLCVFAQLAGGRGQMAFRAAVVDAVTGMMCLVHRPIWSPCQAGTPSSPS